MKIKTVDKSKHKLPEYSTKASSGMYLKANLDSEKILKSGKGATIPAGLHPEIPEGYEAQIRPRSRLAVRRGITVLE